MGQKRRVQHHRAFPGAGGWGGRSSELARDEKGEEREKMMPWFPPFANSLLGPHIAVVDVKVLEVLSGGDIRRIETANISSFQEKLLCAKSRPWASHQYLA